MSKCY